MRTAIRKVSAFGLMIAMLVSGNGVVLAVHTCFLSSTKTVSIFHTKECCSKKTGDCSSGCNEKQDNFSAKCCSSQISYHKLSQPFNYQKSFSVTALKSFIVNSYDFSFTEQIVTRKYNFIPPLLKFSIPFACNQLLI